MVRSEGPNGRGHCSASGNAHHFGASLPLPPLNHADCCHYSGSESSAIGLPNIANTGYSSHIGLQLYRPRRRLPVSAGVLLCPVVDTASEHLYSIVKLSGLSEKDVLVDLGCGDGTVLVYVARLIGCVAVGFDIRRECVESSQRAAVREGLDGLISVHQHDFFDQDGIHTHPAFASATVLFMYLVPEVVLQLEPLLRQAVEDGKVVVIYCSTGSLVRRATDRPPGNVIGKLEPAGIALRGKLRLYCREDVLASRPEMCLACQLRPGLKPPLPLPIATGLAPRLPGLPPLVRFHK